MGPVVPLVESLLAIDASVPLALLATTDTFAQSFMFREHMLNKLKVTG